MAEFFDRVSAFFSGKDTLPWTEAGTIERCEQEVSGKEPGISNPNESIMRLAWALVHSRRTPDVQRGIAMLEAQLGQKRQAEEQRETLYLIAVGYFRLGDFTRSRTVVEQALAIDPKFRQAASLKALVEEKIKTDGVIGIGIAAGAAALLAGGIAVLAAAGRR
eukprot:TRINITY_DN26419_c0_g1_i1.p1 TRINITY_DN26419_c0_g1~~TRINITY_DN26419_c0_g1_i1.p1  ORF type:complete len:163 (+),score=37.45 TRINITY_DN26419_c0_g1_i1:307-795(+)